MCRVFGVGALEGLKWLLGWSYRDSRSELENTWVFCLFGFGLGLCRILALSLDFGLM